MGQSIDIMTRLSRYITLTHILRLELHMGRDLKYWHRVPKKIKAHNFMTSKDVQNKRANIGP